MHTLKSTDWRSAQIPGEFRDVSANIGVALQHFVPAMCLFRHTPPTDTSSSSRPRQIARPTLFFSYQNGCDPQSKIYAAARYAATRGRNLFAITRRDDIVAEVASGSGGAALTDKTTENLDLSFLPDSLTAQCRSLIESYHELHGYARLPDILWKARLGPFIETHREFRQLLKKASTTRSAKKSNEGFVRIATTILSLEILASSFAGWSAIYPEAASTAQAILKRNGRSPHMPLMEFYLYPPKFISSAAIATLAPPANRQPSKADLYLASEPELSGERQALNYVKTIRDRPDGGLPKSAASPA
jgi:hypothetical protein